MRILRDVILIALGFLFSILFPAISELMYPSTRADISPILPLIIISIFVVLGVSALMIYVVRMIDSRIRENENEERKAEFKIFAKEFAKELIDELKKK